MFLHVRFEDFSLRVSKAIKTILVCIQHFCGNKSVVIVSSRAGENFSLDLTIFEQNEQEGDIRSKAG